MSTYSLAAGRIQTAIAFLMGRDPNYAQPKHLRVGIDLRKVDHAGLVDLLIAKGVFTLDEYLAAIGQSAEKEADAYEQELQQLFGSDKIRTGPAGGQ